jgi:hypothetical protein
VVSSSKAGRLYIYKRPDLKLCTVKFALTTSFIVRQIDEINSSKLTTFRAQGGQQNLSRKTFVDGAREKIYKLVKEN